MTVLRAACFLAALVSLPEAAAIYANQTLDGTEPYDTLTNTSGSCESAKGPVDAELSTGFVNCSCIDPNDGDAGATANLAATQGLDIATYGKSFCQAWDVTTTACDGAACPSSDGNQHWCQNAWCYVVMQVLAAVVVVGLLPRHDARVQLRGVRRDQLVPHHGLGEYGVNGLRGKACA